MCIFNTAFNSFCESQAYEKIYFQTKTLLADNNSFTGDIQAG